MGASDAANEASTANRDKFFRGSLQNVVGVP
jgi:hypothetical protein